VKNDVRQEHMDKIVLINASVKTMVLAVLLMENVTALQDGE